jgi:hypothetical protein
MLKSSLMVSFLQSPNQPSPDLQVPAFFRVRPGQGEASLVLELPG